MAEKIDAEIGELLQKARLKAEKILIERRTILTSLAQRLIVEESIEGHELQELLAGSPLEAPLVA